MPSTRQDKEFAEEMEQNLDKIVMSNTSLDSAIDWISRNLNPDDVFSEKDLLNWAEINGLIKQ